MEQLKFGLSVALIGMLVVFVGLCIIIAFIKIIGIAGGERKKRPTEAPAAAPIPEPSPIAAPVADEGVTPEIIAAITAAIAATMGGGSAGFRVRRVKRVSNASAWGLAGREDQIYSRM